MSAAQASKLPAAELIEPGGALMVWCTWPLFAEQSAIVRNAWGLEIATGGVWVKVTKNHKQRLGTGFIFRSVTEPFLIATRGKPRGLRGRSVRNLIETYDNSTLYGVAREHSRKPDEAYLLAERLTPGWKRVDVFARQRRKGWTSWGNEQDKFSG